MEKYEIYLIERFLSDLSERMGNSTCNDWWWPDEFDKNTITSLAKDIREFYGEELDEDVEIMDFMVVDYLRAKLTLLKQ